MHLIVCVCVCVCARARMYYHEIQAIGELLNIILEGMLNLLWAGIAQLV